MNLSSRDQQSGYRIPEYCGGELCSPAIPPCRDAIYGVRDIQKARRGYGRHIWRLHHITTGEINLRGHGRHIWRPYRLFVLKRLAVGLALLFAISGAAFAQSETQAEAMALPDINAAGAVLMEATTGRVLTDIDMDKQLPMASTTKIMTALVALERGNLSDMVTVSSRASGVTGSSIHLQVGEKITLENLLYGLMLASGNDAAVAIAEHIGGSVSGFAELMNGRAKEIGAKNTHFVTPNGLHDDAHYTTAYDLGLIACEAMKNAKFAQIVSTQYYNTPGEGDGGRSRSLKNNNKIIFQFDGGNGVKTGFTRPAGRCLVSAAKRGGMQLVAVVLNCGDMFPESMELLEYGFAAASMKPLVKKGELVARLPVEGGAEKSLELRASRDIMVPLLKGELERIETKLECAKLKAPVKKGTAVAALTFALEGKTLARFYFTAPRDMYEADMPYYLDKIIGQWNG